MFDNTRIKVDPQTAQFDVCMPKFGDLKWVMFQFPSNTRLCEAIHILLVIKLLLGVNYHHHAPPLLLYRLRSEVHPTAHPLQSTRTYNTVAGIAIFITSKLFIKKTTRNQDLQAWFQNSRCLSTETPPQCTVPASMIQGQGKPGSQILHRNCMFVWSCSSS